MSASCKFCGSTAVHWRQDGMGTHAKYTMLNGDGSPHDCAEKRANDALKASIRAAKAGRRDGPRRR